MTRDAGTLGDDLGADFGVDAGAADSSAASLNILRMSGVQTNSSNCFDVFFGGCAIIFGRTAEWSACRFGSGIEQSLSEVLLVRRFLLLF